VLRCSCHSCGTSHFSSLCHCTCRLGHRFSTLLATCISVIDFLRASSASRVPPREWPSTSETNQYPSPGRPRIAGSAGSSLCDPEIPAARSQGERCSLQFTSPVLPALQNPKSFHEPPFPRLVFSHHLSERTQVLSASSLLQLAEVPTACQTTSGAQEQDPPELHPASLSYLLTTQWLP
jgi:hypothetical protein